jgi:hypothetical protein
MPAFLFGAALGAPNEGHGPARQRQPPGAGASAQAQIARSAWSPHARMQTLRSRFSNRRRQNTLSLRSSRRTCPHLSDAGFSVKARWGSWGTGRVYYSPATAWSLPGPPTPESATRKLPHPLAHYPCLAALRFRKAVQNDASCKPGSRSRNRTAGA